MLFFLIIFNLIRLLFAEVSENFADQPSTVNARSAIFVHSRRGVGVRLVVIISSNRMLLSTTAASFFALSLTSTSLRVVFCGVIRN